MRSSVLASLPRNAVVRQVRKSRKMDESSKSTKRDDGQTELKEINKGVRGRRLALNFSGVDSIGKSRLNMKYFSQEKSKQSTSENRS